jgi:hypothetical protein
MRYRPERSLGGEIPRHEDDGEGDDRRYERPFAPACDLTSRRGFSEDACGVLPIRRRARLE